MDGNPHPRTVAFADRRVGLAREWDDLVEQVRRIPGHENFLRPPSIEALLPAAEDGPIVVANISEWRCDLLLVRPTGAQSVSLELSAEQLSAEVATVLSSLQALDSAVATHIEAHKRAREHDSVRARADLQRATSGMRAAQTKADSTLLASLEWLWSAIAEPALDALGLTGPGSADAPRTRMWWCPTGPLTLLPLHAAGHHDGSGRSVLDRVVSSYTPTVRALAEAKRRRTNPPPHRFLIVGDADDLPGAAREIEELLHLLPPERRTLRLGRGATRDQVLEDLPRHQWVHFGCHGDQNLSDPSMGGLLLTDERLRIFDIADLSLSGEFAGLAACKTAVGGTDLPDEAITLAAALHYSGYRHVIGTLWSVRDSAAGQLFTQMYRSLIKDGTLDAGQSAHLLHEQVLALRAARPGEPTVWAPYVHLGP